VQGGRQAVQGGRQAVQGGRQVKPMSWRSLRGSAYETRGNYGETGFENVRQPSEPKALPSDEPKALPSDESKAELPAESPGTRRTRKPSEPPFDV